MVRGAGRRTPGGVPWCAHLAAAAGHGGYRHCGLMRRSARSPLASRRSWSARRSWTKMWGSTCCSCWAAASWASASRRRSRRRTRARAGRRCRVSARERAGAAGTGVAVWRPRGSVLGRPAPRAHAERLGLHVHAGGLRACWCESCAAVRVRPQPVRWPAACGSLPAAARCPPPRWRWRWRARRPRAARRRRTWWRPAWCRPWRRCSGGDGARQAADMPAQAPGCLREARGVTDRSRARALADLPVTLAVLPRHITLAAPWTSGASTLSSWRR
jgi:hypothetical protein